MSDTTKEQPGAVAPIANAQPIEGDASVNPIKEEVAPIANADNTNVEIDATAEKSTEETKTEVKPDTKPEVKSESITRGNKYNNTKSDPKTLPKTDNPKEIRKQVEYYFSDANLPTDKFMWENTSGPENKAVPLKSLCKFGRMHRFEPYSAIVAALKESEFLDITGPDGEEVVSRKVPYKLDPDGPKKRFDRTVYIKGFGEERNSTQFEIEAWIAQYGTVDRIKLRREDDNTFKGSIFAEFSTEETAQKFVALDPAPKFQGKDLMIMTKQAYTEMKIEQIRKGEIEPSKSKAASFYEGRTKGGRGGHNKGSKEKENGKQGRGNGFRGGRGGRGGRGRGRGGRGRGGHGGRDDRSNGRAAAAEKSAAPRSVNGVKEPEIKVTTEKTNGKRAREEDAGVKAPPAKKVDTKAE